MTVRKRAGAMRYIVSLLAYTALLTPLLCMTADSQLLINGAGATFPYPIYSKWFDDCAKIQTAVRFNYQSIGSGGGIMMLRNRTVDLGASDAPLTDAQTKAMPTPVLHFPSVMGAVALMYNLPALRDETIKLTGPLIASIYLSAAAGAAANMPRDFRVSITNALGPQSYPISSFTWLLVYKHQTDHVKGQAILNFLKWALTAGQKDAAPLNYAPLPQAVISKELQALKQISVPAS